MVYKMSSNGYLSSGVSAAGTTQATATAIVSGTSFVQVSTCAAGAGVILPSSQASGAVIRVRNDGVGALLVYPAVGGQINSLGSNIGFYLAANGGEADFIAGLMLATTGNTWYSYGLKGRAVVDVTATQAITAQHSDCDIVVALAGNAILTLPAIAGSEGQSYNFRMGTVAANTLTITAASACIQGTLLNAITAAPVCVQAAGSTSIVFGASSPIGSMVRLVSDGTSWLIDSSYNNKGTAGFTVA